MPRGGHNFIDRTGQVFGWLMVVERVHSVGEKTRWRCRCRCGAVTTVQTVNLVAGRTKSCGCYLEGMRGTIRRTHGQYGTPEYHSWAAAKARCHNPTSKRYAEWGGRGIYMAAEWRDDFARFIADMGPRPDGTSLDRIDNDGPYAPGNCRWATTFAQAANTSRAKRLTFNGRTYTLAGLAKAAAVPFTSLQRWMGRGLSPDAAIAKIRQRRP